MAKVIGIEVTSGDGVIVDYNAVVFGEGLVVPREGGIPQQSVILVIVEPEVRGTP